MQLESYSAGLEPHSGSKHALLTTVLTLGNIWEGKDHGMSGGRELKLERN